MQPRTAADALIDAGRGVLTAGSGRDRTGSRVDAPIGSLAVGTLLTLGATAAPILVVALVGYGVTAARNPRPPVAGVDDWLRIGIAGVRGTALLVGAALPITAALVASGVLDVGVASVALGSAPGPALAVGIGVLAAATWHATAVGIVAVAADGGWPIARSRRFGRSAAGFRLSGALAGVASAVGAVGFGVTAIPVVGSVVAAAVVAVGVAVAGRLVRRATTAAGDGCGATGGVDGSDGGLRPDPPGRATGSPRGGREVRTDEVA